MSAPLHGVGKGCIRITITSIIRSVFLPNWRCRKVGRIGGCCQVVPDLVDVDGRSCQVDLMFAVTVDIV